MFPQQQYTYSPAYQQFEYEEQPQSQSSPKAKKIVLSLLLIIPLLFLLTMLILFIIFLVHQTNEESVPKLTNSVSVAQQLKSDLSLPLFKEIEAIPKTGTCATGKSELPLGEFPGVQKGCLCKEGNEWIVSDEGKCTSSSTVCKKGSGIDKEQLKVFYNNKKLCYKEYPKNEYFWGTEAQCTAHATLKKHCSSGVCVAQTAQCPFTGTYFLTSAPPSTITCTSLSSALYLCFSNSLHRPMIKLELAHQPYCLNQITFPKLPSSSNYDLLSRDYSGCDDFQSYKEAQDSAVMTDDVPTDLNYKYTLGQNSIPYDDNTKSPFYKDYIEQFEARDKWKIFQIFRPIVKNDAVCSSNKGFDNLKHVQSVSSSILKPLFVFTLVGLILSALGLLIWIAMFALSYASNPTKRNQRSMKQFLKLTHILAILVALFVIFIFIYYMSTLSGEKDGLQSGQKGFNSAFSANCYEDTKGFLDALNIIQSFINFILDTAYPFIITFFILALIYLIFFSILSLVCLMMGESPFLPPYTKGYQQNQFQ